MRTIERVAVATIVALGGLAALAHFDHWTAVAAFVAATVALAGMAWVVSFATEEVGERLGPAATGLLQATVGNLPELFVVLFALHAGEEVVAQSAIVGSLFANALLVLGVVVLVGSLAAGDGVMRFNPVAPRDASTLLLVCAFIIVLVGLSLSPGDPVSHHVKTISAVAAVALLVVYLAWVIPYVRGEGGLRAAAGGSPRLALGVALALLVGAGVGAALVSDWFIDALRPAIASLGISQAFAGLVIVAIAGNAVEHVVGVALAARGKSDLAISVIVNSVAQIAAFLFPALVLISLTMHTSLTFSLRPLYIGALAASAIVVWQITDDGEGRSYEGLALMATYLTLAVIAIYD
jgi:Ca2+:H+ antiporter